jgi:hypothetical protein
MEKGGKQVKRGEKGQKRKTEPEGPVFSPYIT